MTTTITILNMATATGMTMVITGMIITIIMTIIMTMIIPPSRQIPRCG